MVTETKAQKESPMTELLDKFEEQGLDVYQEGDIVSGTVREVTNKRVWVDVDGGRFVGVVSARELAEEGLSMPDYKRGDEITASVLISETEEGFMVLSVREALKEQGWQALRDLYENDEVFTAKVVEANRGGLIVEAENLRGFLPVSQLTPEKYPRVGNDKNKILNRLKEFVGDRMEVKVLDLDRSQNKLIFSEREAKKEEYEELASELNIGDVVEGAVSGVVDFGIFVRIGLLEGLVHISEISWDKVDDPRNHAQPGDTIKVKVIDIDGDKISLSMKQLESDPWLDKVDNYEVGEVVEGEVTAIKPFGAFVKVDGEIDGLIHISELSYEHVEDPSEVVSVGEELELKVIDIEPDSHRFGLSLKAMKSPKDDTDEPITSQEASNFETDLRQIGLSDAMIAKLVNGGVSNLDQLRGHDKDSLQEIKGIGPKTADKIMTRLKEIDADEDGEESKDEDE